MNPFLCVVDLDGSPLGADALASALPGLCGADGEVQLVLDDCWAAAWVPSPVFERPAVARRRGFLAVGNARITNRSELAASLAPTRPFATDLELVAELYARRGASGIRQLLGDFAFVLWDPAQQTAFAARDALGVQPLFYQQHGHRLAVASHLDCLEQGAFDSLYLEAFLRGRVLETDATPYQNVRKVLPGSWILARRGRFVHDRFWNPAEFEPAAHEAPAEPLIEELRELFARAVAADVDAERDTWAQLSGGLDSSSVVGMASLLAEGGRLPRGLAGTVTVVDSLAGGDETRYSDQVVQRWGLSNARIEDFWAWQTDADGAPGGAEPRLFLPFFARDRAMCGVVREAGGRVLLSGYGSDQYLSGSFDFVADLVAGRRLGAAARQLTDLAVTTRRSFWSLALAHVVRPLRQRPAATRGAAPAWLAPSVLDEAAGLGAEPGSIFARQVAREVATTEALLNRGVFEQGLEVRYPFLYRPLVEFGLRLPVTLRVRPHQQKWILREALGHVLPPEVRSRTGKGGITGRLVWSLEREQATLRALIADSELVRLGFVRRDALSGAFEAARTGQTGQLSLLYSALSLETWLAVRTGRWTGRRSSTPAQRLMEPRALTTKESHHAEAAVC